jgi:hypothetical protein
VVGIIVAGVATGVGLAGIGINLAGESGGNLAGVGTMAGGLMSVMTMMMIN